MTNPYQPPLDFERALKEEASEYRFVREAQERNYLIKSPADIIIYAKKHIYNPFEKFTQEEIHILICNAHNIVTHDALVYRGTVSSVHVRVAEIFRPAIYYNGVSIVAMHNHPSGNSTPSPADIAVTETIVQAGKLLDCHLLDHCIIGNGDYTSIRQIGIGGFEDDSPPPTT